MSSNDDQESGVSQPAKPANDESSADSPGKTSVGKKDDRALRIINVIRHLQTGYTNLEYLARECGVHPRTVLRDLNDLRRCGIPITFDSEQKRYRMAANFYLPATHFTPEETLALITLCVEGGTETAIPFLEPVRTAVVKLVGILPVKLQEHLRDRGGAMHIRREPVNPLREARSFFERIQTALHERRAVRILYKSPIEAKPMQTLLSAYQLLFARRSWYVLGRSSLHAQVRMFNIGRILQLEETENAYQIPRGFSAKSFFRNAWHLIPEPGPDAEVVVRFSKLVAQNVSEVYWHPTQRIVPRADGSIDFQATVSGLNEISWWILGYGKEAEVIAPAKLREIIARHAFELAAKYADLAPPAHQSPERRPPRKRPPADLPGWEEHE